MRKKDVKRVIHVVSDMHRGGAETMIMNLYRNIDRSKLQFDFICHYRKDDLEGKDKRADYYDEIEKLGGRILKIPSLGTSNPIEYILNTIKLLKENGPFEAIHVHTNKQAGFSLLGAQLIGIKKRIIHSHTANWDTINKYYLKILKLLVKFTANYYCACGEDAAVAAFGMNSRKKVTLLNNSIDIGQYTDVDLGCVMKLKDDLGIDGKTTVIGHVGRIDKEKNHKFIIELARELVIKKKEFIILLVGTGSLVNEIRDQILEFNLEGRVKLLGVRKDIDILMNLFNVFILPSLFEGLPLVAVEAQAAGTKCIISDTVTREIDMGLKLVKQLPIVNESLELWVNEIFNESIHKLEKQEIVEALTNRGYNVKNNVDKLYKLYGLYN